MFILRDLLRPLQAAFTDTEEGRERGWWFVWVLLAVIVPFTSSISSNLLRSLESLFDIHPGRRRFYQFMASPKLPWPRLWRILWGLIPSPMEDGRLLVALDDSINNKSGRKIFGCGFFHDHTAKLNQPDYPWAQNLVSIGLLKRIKGRWACLPLAFRFYLLCKDVEAKAATVLHKGQAVAFQTKLEQAVEMLQEVTDAFPEQRVLVVTDSWFGNDGLYRPLRERCLPVDLLSRLRSNLRLFGLPEGRESGRRGAPRKYGAALGSVAERAAELREAAQPLTVELYGRRREVQVAEQVVLLKTLKRPVRVVWVFRRRHSVALFTTDLTLSIAQIIEYYGARWKIESGFKEIKQELGSAQSQARTADAVTNHLQWCMMAATLVWVYADRLAADPERRHGVVGRSSYAFSDVRRMVAKVALAEDFRRLWPVPPNPQPNGLASLLLRLVA